jgi:replicative DNA helicase
VIGAILLQPERLHDVREWLTASDFEGTAERKALDAIEAVADRGDPTTPERVDEELRREGHGPSLVEGPFLFDCMEACPSPERAAVYGRMVLELSIRRRIAEQGIRLRQDVRATVTTESLNRVFVTVDSARRDVERLHLRESRAAGVKSPTPLRAGAAQKTGRPSTHDSDVAVERTAVMQLVHRPSAIDEVSPWLRPDDFADHSSAALYRQLAQMRDAGEPIDSLTVAWRAMSIGLPTDTCQAVLQQPRPEVLAGDPVRTARRVLEQSVRSAILSTADVLERLGDPAPEPATSLAYDRLNQLWSQQKRLVQARFGAPG